MKFFLPEFGPCFGGTIMTPETETISAVVSTNRQRVKRGNSTKQWRPELSAIAEDGGVVMNVSQQSNESVSVVRSEKKAMNKVKSAGKTRFHSYVGNYRKFSHAMVIPAFSPTPFVF
ncbi:hypothetical protein M8C21_007372 [Ambrosia artemisiifolia]|uniref:Uncharacterized protein n=1 Tax=Ambrosia artemisiifolia TaxID=4212 RepID=A0AAD5C9D1_AMBAR|nr:hypothetical protein M8C21_007372 [Ambrosia artemisiifolia]